jgi:hypothetical protein
MHKIAYLCRPHQTYHVSSAAAATKQTTVARVRVFSNIVYPRTFKKIAAFKEGINPVNPQVQMRKQYHLSLFAVGLGLFIPAVTANAAEHYPIQKLKCKSARNRACPCATGCKAAEFVTRLTSLSFFS